MAVKTVTPPGRRTNPEAAGEAADMPAASVPQQNEFSLKKALFEIAIVAVGVLLALIVDEARESGSERALAEEARAAMRAEIEQNRVRLATKLALLHRAYQALEANPAAGPALVAEPSNFQIAMTDAAWTMATQTGALRLLEDQERQSLAYIYTSQEIYNRLLAEEMNHWTALAAAGRDDSSVKLWKAYGQRVGIGACIASIRIERFRNPNLPPERLQRTCQSYRLSITPQELYRRLGLPVPDTSWRPGGEF